MIKWSITISIILICKTNSGTVVKNEAHLFKVLNELIEEFQTHGKITNNNTAIENYSRKLQTEKLVSLINKTFLKNPS